MNWKLTLAGLLALTGVSAGCATTSDQYPSGSVYHPTPSPHSLYPRTDGPQIDNADAAGPASVPGTHTGVAAGVIVPDSPAASPVIVVPAPPADSPVIVVPPAR
jgi:hypothetical protein